MIICCMSRHVRFLLNEKVYTFQNWSGINLLSSICSSKHTLSSCHKFSRDSLKCNKRLRNALTCSIPGKTSFKQLCYITNNLAPNTLINRLRRTKRTEG